MRAMTERMAKIKKKRERREREREREIMCVNERVLRM
jgi:hypothetical protein